MFRVLFLSMSIALAAVMAVPAANAAPFASLNQPSQTVQAGQNGVHLIAFYEQRDAILDLTVLITDPDGEALRTRIALRDRQHHTLLLDAGTDPGSATRIEFLRTGNQVEMIFSDTLDGFGLSAYQPNESY